MKRSVVISLTIILMALSIFHVWEEPAQGGANSIEEREVIIIGPTFQTFDTDADQWSIFVTAVSFGSAPREGRLSEFTVNGVDIMPLIPKPATIPIYPLDGEMDKGAFKRWKNFHERANAFKIQPFSKEEEREFHDLTFRIKEVAQRRKEVKPLWFQLNTLELPFNPKVSQTYIITLAVQAGNFSSSFQSSILVVNVPENPNWFPAELHIHSNYSDGNRTPAQLASELTNKHYRIGYVTDEPAGWGQTAPSILPRMSDPDNTFRNPDGTPRKPTWEEYANAVRNASNISIVMLPGLEISASPQERTHTGIHQGHALAYGIVNLTGSQTFETTGFRYNWFLPNTLLNNININRIGFSSAAIAHPTHFSYAWLVWGSQLTARYDGMELMSGVQNSFSPNAGPMVRWRSELSHRLSGVFSGQSFPSARTGSDYCGNWYSPPIQYYTFVRLPSTPSNWTYSPSLQDNVDTALRSGRTVTSRLGGLATFTLNGWQIGDRFTHSAGSNVNGSVQFRPAFSGTYRVTVYEDNLSRIVYQSPFTYIEAGITPDPVNYPFVFTFPGGQRFYHVYVEEWSSTEHIYTSPIFIRQ
ncbi:MAG: hypothetical protein DDT42_01578 [candidate division WS2 bacterium]|uniref:Uncharacterized protein n=1 Tax=Psychracetigena formicireducens TaxID=2986056 RepID=A0A9E2BHK2_PSYF1|nr:hypothetical protein [Candidatus Psychracetigena formicireducens]